jgi:hypothetical protein
MTLSGMQQFTRNLTTCVLVTILGVDSSLSAQIHVVNPAELQKEVVAAARSRQRNLEIVTRFLSSSNAEKALRAAHVDLSQVKTAVSALDDQELARLAARSEKAQADFAAGRLSDRDLLIILIGIAALILIIVAVR